MALLTCVLTVRDDPALVMDVFRAEEKMFKHERSCYALARTGDEVTITIEAEDPTALRATVTSVTRILMIVRKTMNS